MEHWTGKDGIEDATLREVVDQCPCSGRPRLLVAGFMAALLHESAHWKGNKAKRLAYDEINNWCNTEMPSSKEGGPIRGGERESEGGRKRGGRGRENLKTGSQEGKQKKKKSKNSKEWEGRI